MYTQYNFDQDRKNPVLENTVYVCTQCSSDKYVVEAARPKITRGVDMNDDIGTK